MNSKLAAILALLALCVSTVAAQSRSDKATRADYDAKLRTLKIEIGQRHLELGVDCRDKGLTTQAAEQFVLAVEESEQLNPGANVVLNMMRTYDDKFWLKRAPKPTPGRLDQYERDAKKVEEKNLAERVELYTWGFKRGLEDEVYGEVLGLLRRRDEPLEFDNSGALTVGSKKLPVELSARIKAESIVINGRTYVRDEFLMRVPLVQTLFEVVDERLRVRSTTSFDEATHVHELGAALLPLLEKDFGARPRKRLSVVIVPDRATYETFLDVVGLSQHKAVSGVADSGSLTAVITTQGADAAQVDGIMLHELTHLAYFGASRSVMPSWYSEALADTYGGPGTFRWKDKKLEVGLALEPTRLAALRAETLPYSIEALLTTDALTTWSAGLERGLAFYAEAWAWMRFLRSGASVTVAADFERWEAMCRGGALGAEIGKPRANSAAATSAAFRRIFDARLPELEKQFVAWLALQ